MDETVHYPLLNHMMVSYTLDQLNQIDEPIRNQT